MVLGLTINSETYRKWHRIQIRATDANTDPVCVDPPVPYPCRFTGCLAISVAATFSSNKDSLSGVYIKSSVRSLNTRPVVLIRLTDPSENVTGGKLWKA